jgi:hypothetical protein
MTAKLPIVAFSSGGRKRSTPSALILGCGTKIQALANANVRQRMEALATHGVLCG